MPARTSLKPGAGAKYRRATVFASAVILAFIALFAVVALSWGVAVWLPFLYGVASIVTFLVYRSDKSAAVNGRRRVSESTLLFLGAIGGWPGALAAQRALRHKTSKTSFLAPFWVTVVLNIGAFLYVCSPAFPQFGV